MKRIESYRDLGLGLGRESLSLVKHNPRWKRAFSDEAHLIYDQLRLEGVRLFHVGSTAIPGISAKPVLDILGTVESFAELDSKQALLEATGYEWKGEYGISGRRYCVLYNPEKTCAYVHLHLFERGSVEVERHILFRDFLRANSAAALEYESEKVRLISELKVPREEYSEAKSAKIKSLLEDAERMKPPTSVLAILGAAEGGVNTKKFLGEKYPSTELIDLQQSKVRPYVYGDAEEDDFPRIVERMLKADLIVFATPVYWYAMSGPLKNFFDRFSHLLRGKYKHLGEALYGKKFAVLVTGYDQRMPYGFEVPFASTAIYMGMDYLGATYRSVQD